MRLASDAKALQQRAIRPKLWISSAWGSQSASEGSSIRAIASAATPIDSSRRHVYSDLNLGTTEGAAVLNQCLHGAAETACDEHGMKDVGSLIRVKA